MKKKIKILLVLLIIFLIPLFYLNSNFYIEKQNWKYRDGYYIGDWIEFNKSPVELKGRKIFLNGNNVARVRFCLGKLLIIKSLNTNEQGFYINK
jgi:hypothetical protein